MGAKNRITDPSGQPWPEHALFPVEPGEKTPEVAFIGVTRLEPGKGKIWASTTYTADELATLADLARIYGGGHYELCAKGKHPVTGNPTAITKWHEWKIAGPSLPLHEIAKDAAPGMPAPVAPAPQAPAQQGGGDGNAFLSFMMQQMAQQHAMQMAQMQQQGMLQLEAIKSQAASAQATTQMMVAMMQSQKAPPPNDPAAMIAALAAVMKKDPEEASGLEVLKAGIELGAKMKGDGEGGIEEVMQTLQAAGSVLGPILENDKAAKELEAAKIRANGSAPAKKPAIAIVAPPPAATKPDAAS